MAQVRLKQVVVNASWQDTGEGEVQLECQGLTGAVLFPILGRVLDALQAAGFPEDKSKASYANWHKDSFTLYFLYKGEKVVERVRGVVEAALIQ